MTDRRSKIAVLAALSANPSFSKLESFPAMESQAGRDFQGWLDRSGLALSLLRRLQDHNATANLATDWRIALEQRLARNTERVYDMLCEMRRIIAAFRSFGVRAVSLKGFTLVPDFCGDPFFRHQTDFDFLVAPGEIATAAKALAYCGYSSKNLNDPAEISFTTPLHHIPTVNDDLYRLQPQRQVDLHTSIWKSCAWLPLVVPQDCLANAQPQIVLGTACLSLSLEDKFLLQVLHVFHHSFRSWIRVSWLLEIATCLTNHHDNLALWKRIAVRAGNTLLMKRAFALILGLTNRLFHTPIPSPLRLWTSAAMTRTMRAWLDHFAIEWAIADWPGSLNNLFLTSDFISDAKLQRQYWRSRLLPSKTSTSLGSLTAGGPKKFFQAQTARLSYMTMRVAAHLKDIVAFPRQQLRWRRALLGSGRIGFDSNC